MTPKKTTADSTPQAGARFSNLLDLPSRQTSERFLELKTTSFWKGLPANWAPISICYRKCPPGPWSKNGHATCPLWKSPHLLSKQSSVCLLPREWTQRLLLAPCFRNHKCSALLLRASASEPFYDFAWPHASFSNHFKRPTAFPLNHHLRPIEAKKHIVNLSAAAVRFLGPWPYVLPVCCYVPCLHINLWNATKLTCLHWERNLVWWSVWLWTLFNHVQPLTMTWHPNASSTLGHLVTCHLVWPSPPWSNPIDLLLSRGRLSSGTRCEPTFQCIVV